MKSRDPRILVVDDHTTDRLKISMAVKRLGHQVETAAGGRQAIEKLRDTPFDLVLLDLLMPEMDGFAVLEAMKSEPQMRDIPVIVVSSLDDTESIERTTALGAIDHLPKSFELGQLETCLNACFESDSAGQKPAALREKRSSGKVVSLGGKPE